MCREQQARGVKRLPESGSSKVTGKDRFVAANMAS